MALISTPYSEVGISIPTLVSAHGIRVGILHLTPLSKVAINKLDTYGNGCIMFDY